MPNQNQNQNRGGLSFGGVRGLEQLETITGETSQGYGGGVRGDEGVLGLGAVGVASLPGCNS